MLRRSSAATKDVSGLAGRGGRHATAAVEMAVVLVFILAPLTVGMFELARGMMVKQTLCAAARKGCRTGILHLYGNPDIINDATGVMRDAGFDATKFDPTKNIGAITIVVTDPNGNVISNPPGGMGALDAPEGSTVSVQVSIPASSVKWVTAFFLTASMMESDTVVMMKQ
jgi:TadE-like protein